MYNQSYYEKNKEYIKKRNLEYYHKNKNAELYIKRRIYNNNYYMKNKDNFNKRIPTKKKPLIKQEEKKEYNFWIKFT
tara:strand:- start:190 stop:420 length:231 start_codon:yes stop_codon:yes gene_type:complete